MDFVAKFYCDGQDINKLWHKSPRICATTSLVVLYHISHSWQVEHLYIDCYVQLQYVGHFVLMNFSSDAVLFRIVVLSSVAKKLDKKHGYCLVSKNFN